MKYLVLTGLVSLFVLFTLNQPVQAGWSPCLTQCAESWDDRPVRPDGLPECCFEGERVCTDDGTYIMHCGDYDYYGDPIWDFDLCLEFPSVESDMSYCEFGCENAVSGVTTTINSGNIFTGITQREVQLESRVGTCYKSNPCDGGDACAYIGEKRCGRTNFAGVAYDSVQTCVLDVKGCLLWDANDDNIQVCLETGTCIDGACTTKANFEQSTCTGGSSDPTKRSGGDRECYGDSLCYCMDWDGDGAFHMDKPSDYPTTCEPCGFGCTDITDPPSCKDESGQAIIGCNPAQSRCNSGFIEKCSVDMGDYFWWEGVDVWTSTHCEFGCHLGSCLANPNDEERIAENQCSKDQQICIENSFTQSCDNDCDDADDNTWCWGTVRSCSSLMCNNGDCVKTLGSLITYPVDVANTTVHFNSLTFDGKYLYTLGRSTDYDEQGNVTIVKMDLEGNVQDQFFIHSTLAAVSGGNNILNSRTAQSNSICTGAIGYYENKIYMITGTPAFEQTPTVNTSLIVFDMSGNYIADYEFLFENKVEVNYNHSACALEIVNDTMYVLISPYPVTGQLLAGGIAAYWLNGSWKSDTLINISGDAYQWLCLKATWPYTPLKEMCAGQNSGMALNGDKFDVVTLDDGLIYVQGYGNFNEGTGVFGSSYIDTYGGDNFYFGQTGNLNTTVQNDLVVTGMTYVGDTIFFTATNSNITAPIYLLKMGTEFTKRNECFDESQKCVPGSISDYYVDCVKHNLTGVWKWYQPGIIGDSDDQYITRCGVSEVCENYWVNHKIKKAQCVDAFCTNVCEIGETRCTTNGKFVETCAYKNVSSFVIPSPTTPISIELKTVCKEWNKTEDCGGYYGTDFGFCENGKCNKRQSECDFINSTVKSSICISIAKELSDGTILAKQFVSNCTDADGDGVYEYDRSNSSGLLTHCRYGCQPSTLAGYDIKYAECYDTFSNSTVALKNTVGDFVSWFKILFSDELSKIIFSVLFTVGVGAGLSFKSWELGISSASLCLLVFMAISFLPLYTIFAVVGFVGLYLFRELSQ